MVMRSCLLYGLWSVADVLIFRLVGMSWLAALCAEMVCVVAYVSGYWCSRGYGCVVLLLLVVVLVVLWLVSGGSF